MVIRIIIGVPVDMCSNAKFLILRGKIASGGLAYNDLLN